MGHARRRSRETQFHPVGGDAEHITCLVYVPPMGFIACYVYFAGVVLTGSMSMVARMAWYQVLIISAGWPIIVCGDLYTLMKRWITRRIDELTPKKS